MKIIIVGNGKLVYYMARVFTSKGYVTTIINGDPDECTVLSHQLKAIVVLGDGSDPTVLEEAGAREADALLAMTSYDQNNLVTCQLARKIYDVRHVVAMVTDPDNVEVFRKLGVKSVFSPTHVITALIEQQTSFDDIINLAPVAEGMVTLSEVILREDSPAAGKYLHELGLPTGTLIGVILRNKHVIVPRGDCRLEPRDRLTLISVPANQGKALRVLLGKRV
jgi:trk system potassium uptake protein TrkA